MEGAASFAAVAVLALFGRSDLTAPAVAIIVGLHFLLIARWVPAPIYYLRAELLVAAGMAGAQLCTICLLDADGRHRRGCSLVVIVRDGVAPRNSTAEPIGGRKGV